MPAFAPLVVTAAAKAAAAAAAKAAFWAAVKKFAIKALIQIALAKAAMMLIGKPKISRQSGRCLLASMPSIRLVADFSPMRSRFASCSRVSP